MQTESGIVYQFGPFEVKPDSGELLKNGKRIRLQELPYRLLLVLLETPGEVISRRNFEAASGPTIRSLILTAASGWRLAN